MKLSHDQVLHIAELAKLALTAEEVELFADQLSEILGHFEVLNQLDTSDLLPTAQAIDQRNVMRQDAVEPSLTTDDALANAPRRRDDLFVVNKILD